MKKVLLATAAVATLASSAMAFTQTKVWVETSEGRIFTATNYMTVDNMFECKAHNRHYFTDSKLRAGEDGIFGTEDDYQDDYLSPENEARLIQACTEALAMETAADETVVDYK